MISISDTAVGISNTGNQRKIIPIMIIMIFIEELIFRNNGSERISWVQLAVARINRIVATHRYMNSTTQRRI